MVQNFRSLKKLLEVYLLGEIPVPFFSGWENKQRGGQSFCHHLSWVQETTEALVSVPGWLCTPTSCGSFYALDTVRKAVCPGYFWFLWDSKAMITTDSSPTRPLQSHKWFIFVFGFVFSFLFLNSVFQCSVLRLCLQ